MTFHDYPYTLRVGDALYLLSELPDNSVDSIVTDPPYGLSKQPVITEVLAAWLNGDRYESSAGGIMNAKWDSFVPGPDLFREACRVLKPGGYLLAFAASRNFDLLGISLRLGGFHIIDTIHWTYGSGFSVASRNVAKDFLAQGDLPNAEKYQGFGTLLKPSHEPILVCRKPLEGSFTDNLRAHGTGALNISACKVNDRFPANTILGCGCLEEHTEDCPVKVLGKAANYFYCAKASSKERELGCEHLPPKPGGNYKKGLLADLELGINRSRPKHNFHPSVKPLKLMRYLVRLVTPPGGLTLDPFCGSGTTGCAAVLEGFSFIGFDLEEDYIKIAEARINHWLKELAKPDPQLKLF